MSVTRTRTYEVRPDQKEYYSEQVVIDPHRNSNVDSNKLQELAGNESKRESCECPYTDESSSYYDSQATEDDSYWWDHETDFGLGSRLDMSVVLEEDNERKAWEEHDKKPVVFRPGQLYMMTRDDSGGFESSSSFEDDRVPTSEEEFFSSEISESDDATNYVPPLTARKRALILNLLNYRVRSSDDEDVKEAKQDFRVELIRDHRMKNNRRKAARAYRRLNMIRKADLPNAAAEAAALAEMEINDKRLYKPFYYEEMEPMSYKRLLQKRKNAIRRKYQRYEVDPEFREKWEEKILRDVGKYVEDENLADSTKDESGVRKMFKGALHSTAVGGGADNTINVSGPAADATFQMAANTTYDLDGDRTYNATADRTYEVPGDKTFSITANRTFNLSSKRSADNLQRTFNVSSQSNLSVNKSLGDKTFDTSREKNQTFDVNRFRNRTFDVPPGKDRTYNAPPRRERTFDVPSKRDRTFDASSSRNRTLNASSGRSRTFGASDRNASFGKGKTFDVSPTRDRTFGASSTRDKTFNTSSSRNRTFHASSGRDRTFNISSSRDRTFNASSGRDGTFDASSNRDRTFNASSERDRTFDASSSEKNKTQDISVHASRSLTRSGTPNWTIDVSSGANKTFDKSDSGNRTFDAAGSSGNRTFDASGKSNRTFDKSSTDHGTFNLSSAIEGSTFNRSLGANRTFHTSAEGGDISGALDASMSRNQTFDTSGRSGRTINRSSAVSNRTFDRSSVPNRTFDTTGNQSRRSTGDSGTFDMSFGGNRTVDTSGATNRTRDTSSGIGNRTFDRSSVINRTYDTTRTSSSGIGNQSSYRTTDASSAYTNRTFERTTDGTRTFDDSMHGLVVNLGDEDDYESVSDVSSMYDYRILESELEFFSSDYEEDCEVPHPGPNSNNLNRVRKYLAKCRYRFYDDEDERLRKDIDAANIQAEWTNFVDKRRALKALTRMQTVQGQNLPYDEEAQRLLDLEITDKKLHKPYYYTRDEPDTYKVLLGKRRRALIRKYARYAENEEFRRKYLQDVFAGLLRVRQDTIFDNEESEFDPDSSFNDTDIPSSEEAFMSEGSIELPPAYEKPLTRRKMQLYEDLEEYEPDTYDEPEVIYEKRKRRLEIIQRYRDYLAHQRQAKARRRVREIKEMGIDDPAIMAHELMKLEFRDKKLNRAYYYSPGEPLEFMKLLDKRRNAIISKSLAYAQDPDYRAEMDEFLQEKRRASTIDPEYSMEATWQDYSSRPSIYDLSRFSNVSAPAGDSIKARRRDLRMQGIHPHFNASAPPAFWDDTAKSLESSYGGLSFHKQYFQEMQAIRDYHDNM